MIIKMELRNWQRNAYQVFTQKKYKGVIKAATGTGKTILGIHFIDDFIFTENDESETFLVVVPKEDLLHQWAEKIENLLQIPVGKIGGGYNKEEKVTVAIINSIRLKKLSYKNLILDECHNYLSDVNQMLLNNNNFEKILALSATPERKDLKTYESYGLEIIFEYSVDDAIKNADLCDYVVLEEGVSLLEGERILYDGFTKTIKTLMPEFNYNLASVFSARPSKEKMMLIRAITKRNQILAKSSSKFDKAINIICQNPNSKIIVFAQYIQSINYIQKKLKEKGIQSAIYHSKEKQKMDEIEKFKSGQVKIMLSARGLDEGLDVPECDMAIIMSGFKGERQIKQRLGRIIRKKDKTAIIYLLYAFNTKDEDWLKEMLRYIG